MFARALRTVQLVELLVLVALASWLHLARGWSVPAVVALAIAIPLGWRAAVVLSSFLLAWLGRSVPRPEHRIGPARTVALLASECASMLRFWLYDCPWEGLALRPDPPAAPASTAPVLVVHGYMANRGYLHALVKRIEAAGLGPVFVPDFTTSFATIEAFADEIHREVERIAAGTGRPKLMLVAHSMGGLGSREYLARHGGSRVERLVTLCSPHHGTVLALFGLGENARQMRRGSAFLADLEAREAGAAAVPTTCVYSTHDNLVSPQESAALAWARTLPFAGLGHTRILADDAAGEAVVAALRG